jgi:MFS family permease
VGTAAPEPGTATSPAAFRRLWVSTASANLADGIVWLLIPVLAVQLGAGAPELALITIANRGPMLVLGLVAGGLADRHDRRRTMLAVQALRIATTLGLLAVVGSGTVAIPALVLAALLLGIGEVFFDTNAQAFVAALVPAKALVAANGRLDAVTTITNTFIGPPLGGWLLAISSSLAVGVAAVAFALAAAALIAISGTFRPPVPEARASLASEIRDGLAFLARDRLLRTLSLMTALQHAALAAVFTVLPLYALAPGPLGLSATGYGLLLSAWGAGSVLGAAVAGRAVDAVGRPVVLIGSTVLGGLALLASAATTTVPVVFAASIVVGGAIAAWGTVNASLRQVLTPDPMRGRVNATHRTLAYTAGIAGAVFAGAASAVVLVPGIIGLAAVTLLIGLLGAPTVRAQAPR